MPEHKDKFPEGTSIRRVIDFATQEFFNKGVKSVTMDDIAHGLQMSKRTLYQLFADKEQLIIACIELITEGEHKLAASLMKSDHNVLEIVLRIIEYRIKILDKISSQYITDITRYEAVKEHIVNARGEAIERALEFLRLGTVQGYFRPDTNFKILLTCLFSRVDHPIPISNYKPYNIHELFLNVGIFHLRGCCTPKGIEIIDRFIERYRDEYVG